MELTQLQGQNIGQKFQAVGGQINIGSSSGNQIQHPDLPSNAAQINVQNGQGEIKPMHPSSPVFVNGNQVKKSSPVKFGDTISVGNKNNVVLGTHPKGQNLNAQQVGQHLGGLNFSGDQIADLTNRIFSFQNNQAIHSKIFILVGILSILLIGIIFSYTKLMGISDQIQKEKTILNKKIVEVNSQIEAAGAILGIDLTQGGGENNDDCDPEMDDCENVDNGEQKSFLSQIQELQSNIAKLKSEQQKAIAEIKKVAQNPKEEISDEQKKKQQENEKIVLENQKNIELMSKNFSSIIKKIKNDIKYFSEFKSDIKDDVKDIKKFSGDFNTAQNVLKEENQIRDNRLKSLHQEIDRLQKKDDNTDVEVKKLKEEINSLEIKIKNLK
ncbi:hypothetical protein LR002_01535 [Candidatus Gracilibacteria bacterium]|nr:hypothetical protein [Candidatus Gracilibacteria bacterium]